MMQRRAILRLQIGSIFGASLANIFELQFIFCTLRQSQKYHMEQQMSVNYIWLFVTGYRILKYIIKFLKKNDQNWICSNGLLVKFFMSLHKMVNHLFSTCMIHSRKLHFNFLLPFLQGNKWNCCLQFIHRLPKIHFQFYVEEETSPQPFFQLAWGQIGTWPELFVNLQNSQNKVLELSKSDHVGLRYL